MAGSGLQVCFCFLLFVVFLHGLIAIVLWSHSDELGKLFGKVAMVIESALLGNRGNGFVFFS